MHRLGIWRKGMLSMPHRDPGASVAGARRPGGCTTALRASTTTQPAPRPASCGSQLSPV